MSSSEAAHPFELESFDGVETEGSLLVRVRGKLLGPEAAWLAQTAVLSARQRGKQVARVTPLSGWSTSPTSDGVEWNASFGVRKSALERAGGVTFLLSLEGSEPIKLPAPKRVAPRAAARPSHEQRAPTAIQTTFSGEPIAMSQRARGLRPLRAMPPWARSLILAARAATLAATVGLVLTPVRRQATVLLVVTPLQSRDPAVAGLPLLQSRDNPAAGLSSAQAFLTTPAVAQLTASRIASGWTEARVASSIKVSIDSSSNLLHVVASAGTGSLASKLANTYAAAALDLRASQVQPAIHTALVAALADLRAAGPQTSRPAIAAAQRVSVLEGLVGHGDPTIRLARAARLDGPPGPGRDALILALALGSGALLGLAAPWLSTLSGRRPIRTERRVTELTSVPIVGRLPDTISVNPPGVRSPSLSRELRGILTLLDIASDQPRTFAMLSYSPGDGKTGAATALAVHLARRGESIALLDLDSRKLDAHRRLGVDLPRPGDEWSMGPDGLHALRPTRVAPTLLVSALDTALGPDPIPLGISSLLSAAGRVIVDTAALSVTLDGLRAAAAVDAVLIVVRLDHTLEQGLLEVSRALGRIGISAAGILLIEREELRAENSRTRQPGRRRREHGARAQETLKRD